MCGPTDKHRQWAGLALAWLLIATAFALAGESAAQVKLTVQYPAGLTPARWPVVVGVPFPQGLVKDAATLTLTANGQPAPADIGAVGRWAADDSIRWVHVAFVAQPGQQYSLARSLPTAAARPNLIEDQDGVLTVNTGVATYRFEPGKACFATAALQGGINVIRDAGDGFYVIDSRGRRSVLRAEEVAIERNGRHHAVVRVRGSYRTDDQQRAAAGGVYFHFFRDLALVRVQHKLIVTEETLDLWFRDIGLRLPLATVPATQAIFPSQTLALSDASAAMAIQDTFPHFQHTESKARLARLSRDGTAIPVAEMPVADDWIMLRGKQAGLAAQLPAFAQQFPKAFIAEPDALTIKFWPSECGRELDFRTETVVRDYFGYDWIPQDHKLASIPNTARATARTHDLWLYPFAAEAPAPGELGATADEIFAMADPAWIVSTGAIDPVLPYDPQRFPRVEEAVRDYIVRNVILPEKVFPNTGYLAWGRNPYTSQGWEQKDGRWYPTLHRHGRVLEYNLKRCLWVLWARSGDPMYYQHARRYNRFLHDMATSNWDTGLNPLGWFRSGVHWHSPCFWGAYDEETIRADQTPFFVHEISNIGYGTSEDVIQFVYDYFMTGDLHSRDAARNYRDAYVKATGLDLDTVMKVEPTYVLLRPLASAYEIDQDSRLKAFGRRMVEAASGQAPQVLNPRYGQNYMKSGEIWAGFYHFHVSTGDELALDTLIRGAERYYRTNRTELIYRGSGMPQGFAAAYQRSGDVAYLAYLRQAIFDFARGSQTLADQGIDPATVDQSFNRPWGHGGAITEVSPVSIGIPVGLRALVDDGNRPLPSVPIAAHPYATGQARLLLRTDGRSSHRLHLYVNNIGDRTATLRLLDAAGKDYPLKVVTREEHRVDKPHGDADWQWRSNEFYGTYESHLFYQLQIDAPRGDYWLDAGRDVSMAVLYSDLKHIVLSAPRGMVLRADRQYYFNLPADTKLVEMYAHRPVRITDAGGAAVELASKEGSQYTFDVTGRAGPLCLVTASDPLASNHPHARVESFVRFHNAPLVLAMEDVSRLFDPPAELVGATPAAAVPAAGAKPGFVDGVFGQSVALGRSHVVNVAGAPGPRPHGRGTIEFWFRPDWSATDVHTAQSKFGLIMQELLRLDPITIHLRSEVKDSGRTAGYARSHLAVILWLDKGAVTYPVIFHQEAGRWYHVAVTWKADGKASDIEVFIDGRRRCYGDYRGGVPADLTADKLAPAEGPLTFGSVVRAGYLANIGVSFDDLRVSRSLRYSDDFVPSPTPAASDEDTWLLLPLDGTTGGEFGTSSRLR